LKPFTDKMGKVLLQVYRCGGDLRVENLRELGVSTVIALEMRGLIRRIYDPFVHYWIIKITGRSEGVARELGR